MEIYTFLYKVCIEFLTSFKFTEREGILTNPIRVFCENPNEDTATEVYNAFLYSFRLPGLADLLEALQKFEVTSSTLLSSHRDHYVHTVNVFLLGIALYTRNTRLRHLLNSSNQYADKYTSDEEEFIYRWGITALFHDVGYPLEIAYKSIYEFTTMLIQPNLMCTDGEIVCSVAGRINLEPVAVLKFPDTKALFYINVLPPAKKYQDEYFKKYPELKTSPSNDLVNAIAEILENKLMCTKKEFISDRIKERMQSNLEDGLLDHGIYSSIVFLKWVNDAFLKAGWNPAYFYFPILEAGAVIFLHNSYDYIFRVPPFNLPPLHIEKYPLAFLLILCDRLQETDRLSYGYIKKGINFIDSSLALDDGQLLLRLYISPDDDENLATLYTDNMKEAISKTLDIYSAFKSVTIESSKKGW